MEEIKQKKCNICELDKPLNEFFRCSKCKDGRINFCRKCANDKRINKNKGIENPKNRMYNIKRGHPLYHRVRLLKTSYGIDLEEYNEILSKQNNVCAICKKPETNDTWKKGKSNYLSVDHDHNTYKIRGILCSKCNSAIGLFIDSPELLLEAAKYLIKSRLADEENESKILEEINELLKKT